MCAVSACAGGRSEPAELFYARSDLKDAGIAPSGRGADTRLARPLFYDKHSYKPRRAAQTPTEVAQVTPVEPVTLAVAVPQEEPVAALEPTAPAIAEVGQSVEEPPTDDVANGALAAAGDADVQPVEPLTAEAEAPAVVARSAADDSVAEVVKAAPEPDRIVAPSRPQLPAITSAGTIAGRAADTAERRDALRALEQSVAADLANTDLRLDLVRHLFFAGEAGDADAATRAVGLLDELGRSRPDDPIVLAYNGASSMRHASKISSSWRRMEQTRRALGMLDRAAEASSMNLEVLYLRAVVTIDLPPMFSRQDQAVADLAYVVERARPAMETGTLDRNLVAASCYLYAQVLLQADEQSQGLATLLQLVRLAPDTPPGRAASAYLQATNIASTQ
jgi:hypothetical protein